MIKVIDEESGVVIAMLDDGGPWVPSIAMWAGLARTIARAYGYDRVTLVYGDDRLLIKVTEECV